MYSLLFLRFAWITLNSIFSNISLLLVWFVSILSRLSQRPCKFIPDDLLLKLYCVNRLFCHTRTSLSEQLQVTYTIKICFLYSTAPSLSEHFDLSSWSSISFERMTHAAGEVMFGTDSHTCNAGAFGQFASGIGNTDAGFILGTGKLLIKVPQTIRFVLDGQMPSYLMAKDLILHIIGEIGVAGMATSQMLSKWYFWVK